MRVGIFSANGYALNEKKYQLFFWLSEIILVMLFLVLIVRVDDYVMKSFELEILYSKIGALLRRTRNVSEQYLSCGSISIDKDRMMVLYQEKEISVSQAEYQLLLLLMENKVKNLTRERLLEQIWDNNWNYVNDNTLIVTIKRLCEKLHWSSCLKTIRSFGYHMEDEVWTKKTD